MLESFIASSLATSLAKDIVREALKGLGKKYSIGIQDVKYVLNSKIEEEFQRCLDVAIRAFIGFLSKDKDLSKSQQKIILSYLRSSSVSEEIWHLLDPGSEYFDRGKLTQQGCDELSEYLDALDPQLIFDSWEEFLKAFSFASRSTPEFREFLRASYEAGSFKALSNIEDVLEKMNVAISEIHNEESVTRQSIQDYMNELRIYRDWANTFQIG